MQRHFTAAKNGGGQRDKITGQRRIFRDRPHRLRRAIPVDVKTERVARMRLNLRSQPEKQRVIQIEGLGDKRPEHGDRHQGERPAGQSDNHTSPIYLPQSCIYHTANLPICNRKYSHGHLMDRLWD